MWISTTPPRVSPPPRSLAGFGARGCGAAAGDAAEDQAAVGVQDGEAPFGPVLAGYEQPGVGGVDGAPAGQLGGVVVEAEQGGQPDPRRMTHVPPRGHRAPAGRLRPDRRAERKRGPPMPTQPSTPDRRVVRLRARRRLYRDCDRRVTGRALRRGLRHRPRPARQSHVRPRALMSARSMDQRVSEPRAVGVSTVHRAVHDPYVGRGREFKVCTLVRASSWPSSAGTSKANSNTSVTTP